jgi:hypothetical protein
MRTLNIWKNIQCCLRFPLASVTLLCYLFCMLRNVRKTARSILTISEFYNTPAAAGVFSCVRSTLTMWQLIGADLLAANNKTKQSPKPSPMANSE